MGVANCSRHVVSYRFLIYLCHIMEDRWKTQLRRQASARHMCEENRLALEGVASKEEAVALYLKTIDWALEEGYPRLDTLREYFADCEPYGVYIDRHFNSTLFLDKKVYVFHHCSGKIRVGLNRSKSIIPMIYLANGCNLEIKAADNLGLRTRVPIYNFGENRVLAEDSENIVCKIYNLEVK